MKYTSNIELGALYRDRQTEVQGIAVVVAFHQHSCERVVIETKADDSNDVKFYEFDSVRLDKIGQGFAPKPEPEPESIHEPTRPTGATQTPGLRRTGRSLSR